MNRFLRFSSHNPFVLMLIALAIIAALPAARAQSSAQLGKHARKMEKRLAKFRPGTLMQIDLRDDSEALGSLGELSEASFQLTSSDNNRKMTISYADVAHVKRGKEYIGEGSEPGRHIPHLVPILIGVAAAGAAVALVETKPF
jgi:hypothetical protein